MFNSSNGKDNKNKNSKVMATYTGQGLMIKFPSKKGMTFNLVVFICQVIASMIMMDRNGLPFEFSIFFLAGPHLCLMCLI